MTKPTTPTIELIKEGICDRKGRNITHINLSGIESAAASHFIICEGTSTTHVAAIADNIREHLQKSAGIKPYNYGGYEASQWIVIDYGDTFVHVFLPEFRQLYNLEELWNDAEITEYPNPD